MNKTIKLINERSSIRKFNDEKIATEEMDQIINAAMRAPTAGNMMMYSIIKIQKKETLKKLAESCDHQPFIATADTALVFIADMNKWHRYFMLNNIDSFAKAHNNDYSGPTTADFMLAVNDAIIASQNAVIAAESLSIGSCYIGDIMENYEYHQELLNLPDYAFPCGMLVFGHYDYKPQPRERFNRQYIVFEEQYKPLSDQEINSMFASNEERFNPDNSKFENFAQAFYDRKVGAEFFKEMNRSIEKAWYEWTKKSLT